MGKTVENPKKHIVSCRIDNEELEMLQAIAAESGTSISTLLRQSLQELAESFGPKRASA